MALAGSSKSLLRDGSIGDGSRDGGSMHRWPNMQQLRVAVSKLRQDLDELQSPVPTPPNDEPLSRPMSFHTIGSARTVGAGPLAFYHRGVAVRMLRDYLQDLTVLNQHQLLNVAAKERHSRLRTVDHRIEEYRMALEEMVKVDKREPDGQLTWQERDILKRMLEDYSRGLEESLDYPDDYGGSERLEDQLRIVQARIDVVDAGMPLEFSDTRFEDMVESLTASLQGCGSQVDEISQLQLNGFQVFNLQCNCLVDTLLPTARDRLARYNKLLGLVTQLDIEAYEVAMRSRIFKTVAFCIESLSELARQLQAVVDILAQCNSEKWWITAFELSNVPPQFTIVRWSSFSLSIRSCEWSMDITAFAFHALDQLLNGESTLLDVAYNWSDEQRRMVLEIDGKAVHRQESRVQREGLLTVMRELESEDVKILVQKLVELTRLPRKRWTLDDTDANMHAIATYLSQKLDGPIPGVNILPYSFTLTFDDLKYSHYIDKGASGMVAEYKWFGQRLAVKTVKSPGLERKKFEEEAAILATVQHPFVVRMIGTAFNAKIETGLLAMELMEHDLWTVIKKRCPVPGPGLSPFPLIVAIDIMLQIAEGMQYLREHRILHRDLKAKNVLLNRCRRVRRSLSAAYRRFPDLASLLHTEEYFLAKLADFGIAKAKPLSTLTQMVGTTSWRAPEVFHVPDLETTPHYKWPADVYSFAMTCYEILTGSMPFEGVPFTKIYERVMANERPSLEDVNMPSPALKDLIYQCWATDPNERPTFDDICRRLWHCKVETILPVFRLHLSPSRTRSEPVSSLSHSL